MQICRILLFVKYGYFIWSEYLLELRLIKLIGYIVCSRYHDILDRILEDNPSIVIV